MQPAVGLKHGAIRGFQAVVLCLYVHRGPSFEPGGPLKKRLSDEAEALVKIQNFECVRISPRTFRHEFPNL